MAELDALVAGDAVLSGDCTPPVPAVGAAGRGCSLPGLLPLLQLLLTTLPCCCCR